MFEAAIEALLVLLQPVHLGYLGVGVFVGLIIGILPGVGGVVGMAILLPFVFGLDHASAIAMLIGMAAVVPTADTFSSVLVGIPGSAGSQATILDGYPLTKRGQAAFALSASFAASLAGGLIGALVLSLSIPIARPLVLSIGSPELLMLGVLGLCMVGVLSGSAPLKGIVAAVLGLLIGTIGGAPAVPQYRFTFDEPYLMGGIPLVVVGLGLFAIPEIIDLLTKRVAISDHPPGLGRGWMAGVVATYKHKWLVIRHGLLGAFIGFIPGVGGAVSDWVNYGVAVQTSRDKQNFGKGDIRGVIAPESANNAKEGGSLIPTLLFGIPGSGTTAMLLGGLIVMGIRPGPDIVRADLDLLYLCIWSLAIANVIGCALCIALSVPIARLTYIPFQYMAPFIVVLIAISSYQATRHWGDIFALMALGILGWIMKRTGMPRPPLLVGFVLCLPMERYLWISMTRYEWGWLLHPGVIVIGLISIALVLLGAFWGRKPRVKVEDSDG